MNVISRRGLLGGAAVIVAAGAGVAGGLARPERRRVATPPSWLVAAVAREQTLITGAASADQGAIADDHRQHLAALRALGGAVTWPAAPSSSPSPSPSTAPTREQLRTAEQQAARDAASESAALDGQQAALLASIAACEAGHAELLA